MSRGPTKLAGPDDPLRYVECIGPACPKCHEAERLRVYRTDRQDGGEKSQHVRCLTCDWRFVVLWEVRH